MKNWPFFLWCAFFLVLALNFASTVLAIMGGDFDRTGLPPEMTIMEAVANGFAALGWAAVLISALFKRYLTAARLAVFLAGFFFFDVITTFVLPMPLPPYFLIWGSAVAGLMLLGARHLQKEARYA
jgi:hypothetical protein